MNMHKVVATGLGIGYMGKGGGTVAAAVCAVAWYLLFASGYDPIVFIVTALVTVLGVWSAGEVEASWGKDSSRVVIDEIAGMCVSLLFIPLTVGYVAAAFILFRFFDIVKPLYIRRTEKLPKGWGVMLDDVVAGIYANILLQIWIQLNLF